MRSVKALIVHLLLIGLFLIVIVFGAYLYLFEVTRHGEAIETPAIKNMSIEDARQLLEAQGLQMVVHDSVFHPQWTGIIIDQVPHPGELIKQGRKIYVVVSKSQPGKVAFPDIMDMPINQAIRTLEVLFIKVDSMVYVPDISEGIVLKAFWNGTEIHAGDSLYQLDKVVLVVSKGLESEESVVPDVRGLPLPEAELILVTYGFQLGNVIFPSGNIDSAAMVVNHQHPTPSATQKYPRGYLVDLWMIDSASFAFDSSTLVPSTGNYNLFEE